jgi:hypothetical protein
LVLNIISPEFSFLDFNYNEYSDTCDAEHLNVLPACNDLGIKAQIEIQTDEDLPTTTPIYIAIADSDCNVIYDADIEVTPICSLYKFYTDFEGDEVLVTNPYNLCNTDNDTPTETIEFITNPFDEITSTDLEFDMISATLATELQIYCENKIYIIRRNDGGVIGYTYTQTEDVYIVYIEGTVASNRAFILKAFLNEVFDVNHGTTSTYSGVTVNIANIPAGSYLNNYGLIGNISTVTASTNTGNWFYWKNSKINFSFTNQTVSDDIVYSFEETLSGSNVYSFKFYYTSIYNDMTGSISFDDGTNPPTVINVNFDSYDGFVEVDFQATLNPCTISINVDNNNHINGISFYKIEKYDTLLYNVTNNISGNVPVAVYSRAELIALISDLLGFDFDCEFTSCCTVPDIEFDITLPNDDSVYHYTLTSYWRKGFINFPELPLETIIPECFTYAILDSNKDLVACSNLFEKVEDCCFVTKIEYSNNEDAFGFTYPTGVTNSVNFPFFLHSPQYPTTEKIYKQTNGQYRRLSADIEKEYECETDYIQESYHDKLITALKHDTLIVTSNRLGFTTQMSQQGDYSPDWNSKIEFTSKAEFKLKKYFNGKNSNCGANC